MDYALKISKISKIRGKYSTSRLKKHHRNQNRVRKEARVRMTNTAKILVRPIKLNEKWVKISLTRKQKISILIHLKKEHQNKDQKLIHFQN